MSPESAPPAEVEEFLSGRLAQVDVRSLQKELRALWKTATSDDAGTDTGHAPVARVCVLNLILFSTDPDAETSAADVLDDITVRHPCRAILAIWRNSETPRIEAWVSARCHLPSARARKQICCEQITVRSEGQGVQELPSVVLPLLVDDLPTFLWWRTNDFENASVEPFISQTDRLIIDSSLWTSPARGFQNLQKCMVAFKETLSVSDINWRRLTAWRNALATCFDDDYVGLSVEDLKKIDTVEMQFNGPAPMRPLLLSCWLAARLRLNPADMKADSSNGTCQMQMKGPNGTVTFKLTSKPAPETPPGAVTGVTLKFDDGRRLEGHLQVEGSRRSILLRTDTEERTLALKGPFYSESALMGEELSVLNPDPIYEEAVSMAARLSAMMGTNK